MELILNDKMSYSHKRLIFTQMNDKPTIMLSVDIAPGVPETYMATGMIMALDVQDLLQATEFFQEILRRQEVGRRD